MMSTELTIALIAHVYLFLGSGILFYLLLLDFLSKREVSMRSMQFKTVAVFISTTTASLIVWLYLRPYFIGRVGHRTEDEILRLFIPYYVQFQTLLLPFIFTLSVIMFLLVMTRAKYIKVNYKLQSLLVGLASIGMFVSGALMFLGVLAP